MDFLSSNQVWFERFLRHVEIPSSAQKTQVIGQVGVQCDDGLVLRPVLLLGRDVDQLYSTHEFGVLFAQTVGSVPDEDFWYVEITWPDIYCHEQSCCGSVVLDHETLAPVLIHLPGMCMVIDSSNDSAETFLAQNEDAPRSHFRA